MIKKIILIVICVFGMVNLYAKDVEPIRLIDKHDGKYAWYDVFHLGEVKYANVWTTYQRSVITDPCTGTCTGQDIYTLHCTGDGNNLCRWTNARTALSNFSFRGIRVSDELLDANIDELLDAIDQELLEKGTPSGNRSKKIKVTEGEKSVVLLLNLAWTGGNKKGDAYIAVYLTDITDYIK